MGVFALVSGGAIVFVVEFFAGFLGWLWPGDLSLEGVREVAAEAILAVAHIVVNAGIETSFDMILALGLVALINSEVLVGTKVLDHLDLLLESFILEEFFVIHGFDCFVDNLLN